MKRSSIFGMLALCATVVGSADTPSISTNPSADGNVAVRVSSSPVGEENTFEILLASAQSSLADQRSDIERDLAGFLKQQAPECPAFCISMHYKKQKGFIAAMGKTDDPRASAWILEALQVDADLFHKTMDLMGKLGPRTGEDLKDFWRAQGNEWSPTRKEAVDALTVLGSNSTASLLQAIQSERMEVRADIIKALGKIGDTQAVDPILRALNDPDLFVRINAVEALGQIGDLRAVDPLVKMIGDNSSNIRVNVIRALGRMAPSESNDIIVPLLKDKKDEVRFAAAETLAALGDDRCVEPLAELLENDKSFYQKPAADALAKIGNEAAVQVLASAIGGKAGSEALNALSQMGPIGFQVLEQSLHSEDGYTRRRAARLLAEAGASAIPQLTRALESQAPGISQIAVEGLAESDNPSIPSLLAALTNRSSSVQNKAQRALADMGPPALEPLALSLEHDSDRVRYLAVEALSRMGKQAKPYLVMALSNRVTRVRSTAASALKKQGWSPTNTEQQICWMVARKDWDACLEMGSAAKPVLAIAASEKNQRAPLGAGRTLNEIRDMESWIEELTDANSSKDIRLAPSGLGRIANAQAIDALLAALYAGDKRLKMEVLNALEEARDDRAVIPLGEYLSTVEDGQFQYRTARTLAEIRSEAAADVLIAALAHSNSKVRGPAADGLGRMGYQKAVDPLIQVLQKDEDGDVRWMAAQALDGLGNSNAVPALLVALAEDPNDHVRSASVKALGSIGGQQALETLIQVLVDDKYESQRAVAALGLCWIARKSPEQMKNDRVLGVLLQALSSPTEGKYELTETLEILQDPRTIEPLLRILKKEKNPEIRERIEACLLDMKDIDSQPLADYRIQREDVNWAAVGTGGTKLHQAATDGDAEAVAQLLAKGADIHLLNLNRQTPLMNATSGEVARQLLSAGVDVNARDSAGGTALLYAVQMGNADLVDCLISEGADTLPKDWLGNSALHYAVSMDQLKIVKLLIEHGAKINTKNINGETPLRLAEKMELNKMVEFLRKRGGVSAGVQRNEEKDSEKVDGDADPVWFYGPGERAVGGEAHNEPSPEDGYLQGLVRYMFSKTLEVGDSVRYSMVDDETGERLGDTEVRVIRKEDAGLWIREKAASGNVNAFEAYYLIDPESVTLLQAYSLDESGESNDVTLVSSQQASKDFQAYIKSFDQDKIDNTPMASFKYGKLKEQKKLTLSAGTFLCEAIEPQFDADQMEGMMPNQIEFWRSTTGTYFSWDVPRLIPTEIMVNILCCYDFDIFRQCEGGVVKNVQYQLIKYTHKGLGME